MGVSSGLYQTKRFFVEVKVLELPLKTIYNDGLSLIFITDTKQRTRSGNIREFPFRVPFVLLKNNARTGISVGKYY